MVALLGTPRVVLPASVTGPLKVAGLALLPPSVGVRLSWTGLLNVRPAAVGRNVPPESQSVPLPSGVELARLSVPPDKVVSPLTVALLATIRLPRPPATFSGP